MRKKLKPIVVLVFFLCFILTIVVSRQMTNTKDQRKQTKNVQSSSSSSSEKLDLSKPIIDLSGWQLPSEIDYNQLASNVSGVIVRIQSGSYTKKENAATYSNGLDKAYKTHIKEFQKRNIPVAVYAYVAASSIKEMEKEAESFYKASSKYKPTFYWLDVEEKTMNDMNAGVEAFRAKLASLGAKNIGIYVGVYFMEEHSISVDNYSAIWIPSYGTNSGYYESAPKTDLSYELHQYTSHGNLGGFEHHLDLNLISSSKNKEETFRKLFLNP